MKKSNKLTATSLRTVLIVALLVTIGATCYGFYKAQIWLTDYATTVGQTINSSKSGTMSPEGLASLEQALVNRQSSIEKAAAMTTSSANYQSQAISDLNIYAAKTNIIITDYSVADIASTNSTIGGVTSKYLKISLRNPIKMDSLLQFLSLIETNLPKMQLTGISLSQASGNMINIDPLTIELYTE